MSYSHSYRKLFGVEVRHDYFLDSGNKKFAELSPAERKSILERFDAGSFLTIVPTERTKQVMQQQRMLMRSGKDGFAVGVQIEPPENGSDKQIPFIGLDKYTKLDFLLKVADPSFENYTGLSFSRRQIYFFANYWPAAQENMQSIPTDPYTVIDSSWQVSESDSYNLLQGISATEKSGIFGLISLQMTGDFSSLLDGPGIYSPPQVYRLNLPTRETAWRYMFSDSPWYAETNKRLPLTRNGYISIGPGDLTLKLKDPDSPADSIDLEGVFFPSPDARRVEKSSDGHYYSVIFI
jgi:hypothetical protein